MNVLTELTQKALALPTEQRLALAQDLWASLEDSDLPGFTEEALREELQQRLRDEPDGGKLTRRLWMRRGGNLDGKRSKVPSQSPS